MAIIDVNLTEYKGLTLSELSSLQKFHDSIIDDGAKEINLKNYLYSLK